MNKEQAKLALKAGRKITHKYFSDNEFVYMDGNKLTDEKGLILKWDEFWLYRNNLIFDKDWDIKHSPEAVHRASILKPENIDGCKSRIKEWKSDLLLLKAMVLNLEKEIQTEEEVIEILSGTVIDESNKK